LKRSLSFRSWRFFGLSHAPKSSRLALAGASYTAGGTEILSVSREAGHDELICALADFL